MAYAARQRLEPGDVVSVPGCDPHLKTSRTEGADMNQHSTFSVTFAVNGD